EAGLVEQFKAHAAAWGQAGDGELQAQFSHPRRGHKYGRAVLGRLVFRGGFLELLDHGAGVFGGQTRIEGAEVLRAPPLRESEQRGGHQHRGGRDAELLRHRKVRQKLLHLFHRRRPLDLHLHDCLVSRNHFVSDLQERFKGQFRALRGPRRPAAARRHRWRWPAATETLRLRSRRRRRWTRRGPLAARREWVRLVTYWFRDF